MSILLFCVQQVYTSDNPSMITLCVQGYMPPTELVSKLAAIGLNNIKTHVDSQYVSVVNTFKNYVSDDAALLKLGYPPKQENRELAKWQDISKRYFTATLNNTKYKNIEEEAAYVGRREQYVKRAINFVSNRTDGDQIAHWCLQHFTLVINKLDQARLATYIKTQTEHLQRKALASQERLKDVLSVVDSSVLDGWTVIDIESDQVASSEKREDTADEIAEKK